MMNGNQVSNDEAPTADESLNRLEKGLRLMASFWEGQGTAELKSAPNYVEPHRTFMEQLASSRIWAARRLNRALDSLHEPGGPDFSCGTECAYQIVMGADGKAGFVPRLYPGERFRSVQLACPETATDRHPKQKALEALAQLWRSWGEEKRHAAAALENIKSGSSLGMRHGAMCYIEASDQLMAVLSGDEAPLSATRLRRQE